MQIFERDGWRCWYCGVELLHPDKVDFKKLLEFPNAAVVDHILPVIKGGGHSPDNLRASCCRCNGYKGTKSVEEYRQYVQAKDCRHFRAARLIDLALAESESLYDAVLVEARDWHAAHIQAVIFYGETN